MLTHKVFINPTNETKANRDGIVYVISRMKWYCELSILLLRGNTAGIKISARVRGQLKQRVINLYQALLLYLIKSVGSCYRNQFIAFLREKLKLDDWDGSLKSVEVAENAVRQSYAYTAQQISRRPEYLPDVAQSDNLCFQCRAFLEEEIKNRISDAGPENMSPSDWAPIRIILHPKLSSLWQSYSSGCRLCILIWHALGAQYIANYLAQEGYGGSRHAVMMSTNPGGKSMTVRGQTCHLIVQLCTLRRLLFSCKLTFGSLLKMTNTSKSHLPAMISRKF